MHISLLWKAGVAPLALLITAILALAPTAGADDQNPLSILYYEPIRLVDTPPPDKGSSTLATDGKLAPLIFDAYGRRFELQPDEMRTLHAPDLIQLRGRLAGLADSWFSLLRDGDELSGIIADGIDTYLVEPHHRVADLLIEPSADNAPANVIFRLADTLVPQGLMACATQEETLTAGAAIDGQSAFTKLGAELQATTSNASASNYLPLLVGVIADESFVSRHAAETENEIAAIFNTVQGIISNEIGIELEIDDVISVTPDIVNPFSDTVVATDLLDELGGWRNANQAHLGHTHLLTAKSLINDSGKTLAGISYLGVPGRSGICNRRTGASLSRDIRGLAALIVTHEIGHNLGAPHDGDPDGACASTPDMEFIMSPRISRTTAVAFSDCSLTQIDKLIAEASCLYDATQTLPANSEAGGGGGALGWLSIMGLFAGMMLRRKRPTRIN